MKITQFFFRILLVINIVLFFCSCESDAGIEPLPDIELNPENLVFENVQERKSVTLKNKGNIPLNWDLRAESNFILASPFAGKLNPGEEVAVEIRLLGNDIPEGLIQSKLQLSTDKNIGKQVPVQIISDKSNLWYLDFDVVDAVYDSIHDSLLALTKDKRLLLISPPSKSVKSIPLEIQGIKLSLHPDGKSIAVGSEKAVSFIDLESEQLIKRKGLTFPLFDLVLAKNNWVYITPADFNHTSIYCVNLTGEEADYSSGANIYGFSKIKLHPSGDFIMSTTTLHSPDDVVKYSLAEGWAKSLYDSPYHGDYRFGGDFWFTPSGDRFFGRSGNVFHFSSEGSIDLTQITKLNAPNDFSFVAQSSKKERIYSVHDVNLPGYSPVDEEPFLAIYDLSYTKIKEYRLSKMIRMRNGQIEILRFEVPFGFFNRNQDSMYLLRKSKNAHTGKEVWAIQSLVVE